MLEFDRIWRLDLLLLLQLLLRTAMECSPAVWEKR